MEPVDVVDGDIQRELLRWYKEASSKDAERCLLCFISWILKQECVKLKANFANNHKFSLSDLLPYVLNDNGKEPRPGSPECFSRQILQSFDSTKGSSLTTWTIRKFKQYQPLNKFLLECGVYRISDWAILNDTKLPYLTKVLQNFYNWLNSEIQNAECLLQSYHEVYRLERLKDGRRGTHEKCVAPTTLQLQKIAALIAKKSARVVDSQTVIKELQTLASRLREYRIYKRGGSFLGESIDAPIAGNQADDKSKLRIDEISASVADNLLDENYLEGNKAQFIEDFLEFYRQQSQTYLRQALTSVIESRVEYLQRKKGDKAQNFLIALELSECQNIAMTEIAKRLGIRAQDAVSRLLKLKELYADVHQELLKKEVLKNLGNDIFNHLRDINLYSDLESLKALNKQITDALAEDVSTKISVYLCEYLNTRKN
ncbi:hypothetical protein [Nostoc favosum]|uniref:Uncharacterized protein n=1 Tax=Nostoc favosum CHAB5714 TaxID=2780399 RepID=A0ABS8IIV8_9NOSO|nr:hypothetical protein [Nostoc favosum]MCC5603814.1 hypothetical protein [Nostoc favosum CHAB5714]